MARFVTVFAVVLVAFYAATSPAATGAASVAADSSEAAPIEAGDLELPEGASLPSEQPEIVVVHDVNTLLRANPNLKATPLTRVAGRGTQIRYTAGARVAGDVAVSMNSNSISYASLRDIELTVTYPRYGLGSIVTYIEIVVNQSSIYGNAYILSGGIGQRRIVLVVEAYASSYFSYAYVIYGI